MKDMDVAQFKVRLLQMRSELRELEEASEEDQRPVELDQARVGRLSRMDAMQAQEMAHATSRRRRNMLLKIEGALGRVESGEYGCCFVCGEEIDLRRLAADPTSTRCMECVEA